uniref:Transposase n=1 Tax=Cyprinus carpio carpio TaxID=630221 RepID=A0A9J7ZQK9_CYPCA
MTTVFLKKTASHLCGMESTNLWHLLAVIPLHDSLTTFHNSFTFLGFASETAFLTSPHKFSIGLRSGDWAVSFFGSKGHRQFVRRPPNSEFKPQYTVKTVKHGGASIMIWACFSYYGVGPIYRIPGIMDQFAYVKILEEVMLLYAEEDMPLKWLFQQDNDPKHTSKLVVPNQQN